MTDIVSKRGYSQYEELLTVEMFKERFLFGVDLRDKDGNPISDGVLDTYVSLGIDYVEHLLQAPILPQDFDEVLDYKLPEYRTFVYLQLISYPIVDISEVKLTFGNGFEIDFPQEWFKTYHRSGQIQLLPTFGTFQRLIFTSSGQVAPSVLYGKFAPQILRVKGRWGLANELNQVQPLLNQAVGLWAALQFLQMMGDIGPAGPGVASTNISMDGLSQGVSTAISATSNLFGATLLAYEKKLEKEVVPLLQKRYKRIKLVHI